MAYPDPNLSDMSIGQLLKIIRDEVQTATPAIPKNIQRLEDSDSPLIYPNSSDDGQGLFYNSSTGKYEPTLVDAPNLAANIILASQLIAGDPNAARVEVGVDSDNNTGVRSFDANSDNTFNIDAQDGSVYVKGRIDWGTTSRLLSNDIMELGAQVASGFQTPARVQVATKQYNGFASSNDVSGSSNITWNAGTSNGALLLLVVTQRSSRGGSTIPTLPTVSGWTQVQTVTGTDSTGGKMRQTIFKIESAASRSGNEAINFTGTSNTRYFAARMYEYSGVATIDVTAAANSATGTSPLTTTASGVLAQAGELLFAAFGIEYNTSTGGNTLINSVGGGFSDAGFTLSTHTSTHPVVVSTDVELHCAELVTTSTLTETASAVSVGVANTGAFWMAQLLTFKASSASGTPSTPSAGIARLYAANDVAGNPVPHVLDAAGNANSVLLAPAGNKYAVEVAAATVSIPSTLAGATSTIAVSLGTLAVGDVAVWIGVSAGSAFTFYTDPICTSGGSITLRYHNTDDGAAHALATQTHTFLIIHRS